MTHTTKHIFTSSKGGLGKTTLAVCANSVLLRKGLKTAILDCNPCNRDITRIYSSLELMWSNQNKDFLYRRDARFLSKDEPWGFMIYTPQRMPKTAEEFWRLLSAIDVHEPEIDVLLVDTNMHISQLLTEKPDAAPPNGSLNIYYIWSWTSPLYPVEMYDIDAAITRLVRELGATPVHVFNMYGLYGTAFAEIIKTGKGKRVVKPLKDAADQLAKMNGSPWMVQWKQLHLLVEVLGRSLLSYNLSIEKMEERIPVQWKQLFLTLKDVCPKGCAPANMLVIPDYYQSIVNIRDKLTLMRPTSMDAIDQLTQDVRQHVVNLFSRSGSYTTARL